MGLRSGWIGHCYTNTPHELTSPRIAGPSPVSTRLNTPSIMVRRQRFPDPPDDSRRDNGSPANCLRLLRFAIEPNNPIVGMCPFLIAGINPLFIFRW
jgi:hypothetical protein